MTAVSPRTRPAGIPLTRLCILLTALAVIARARVAILPGWVVPLPALIVAAAVIPCLAVLAWHATGTLRVCWPAPRSGRKARVP